MLDAMWKRRSVRVFEDEALSVEDVKMIHELIEEAKNHKGPFGHQVDFFLKDGTKFDGQKMGTYGTVKHPQMIVGGFTEEEFDGFVDYGYLLEELILKITKLEVGSLWVEGHFDPSNLGVEEVEGKIVPALCPIGYPKGKELKKRQFHINPKKEQRKDMREFAFVGKKLKPMNESDLYHDHIRAVQIAPSGSNKQPWRFVVMNNEVHVYLERTKGYGASLPKDIQAIDIGIALRHLTFSLEEHKVHYEVIRKEPMIALENASYVCTVKIEK
ncbi:MAG: nitroreductase family protein [Candidatus Izemoplasmataceae bacterium]